MFKSVNVLRQLVMATGMLALVACGGGGGDGGGGGVDPGTTFAVKVAVTGLGTNGVVKLLNNSGDELVINSDTPTPTNTQFATKLKDKASYEITVAANGHPIEKECTIAAAKGIIQAADVMINVTCSALSVAKYAVKVNVSGLNGGILKLTNNGADLLTIRNNTPTPTNIAFATRLIDQAIYSVLVDTAPAGQICNVEAVGNKINAQDTTVNVTCSNTSIVNYSVNVNVSGLASKGLIRLQLNNDLNSELEFTNNTTKAFSSRLLNQANYTVTISTPPIGQSCSVVAPGTTIPGSNVTVSVTCSSIGYTIGGTAATFAGTLKLILNQGTPTESAPLTVLSGQPFTFTANPISFGAGYNVTVDTHPAGLTCSVNNGFGLITTAANVTDVTVSCSAIVYTIGGNIIGLNGTVTLLNNGSDPLDVTSTGASVPFIFSAPIGQGNDYLVSIGTQPATQTCVLTDNGAGGTGPTPANANVTNVVITCNLSYSVNVDVRNLVGSISFLNNGVNGDALNNITADGIHTISIGLVNPNPYNVTISTQPTGQVCFLATNSTGIIQNADVTVIVTCSADTDSDGYLDINDFFPFDPTRFAKATLDLSTLKGSNGFTIDGVDANDLNGIAVSYADINNDGRQDIIIGASEAKGTGRINGTANQVKAVGETYVIFGTPDTFIWPANFDLTTLDGTNGFVVTGIDDNDRSGASVSGLGDINGDGNPDFVIGASQADTDSNVPVGTTNDKKQTGEAYVIFGKTVGWVASLDLKTMTAADGFRIHGVDELDLTGYAVSDAGDINADGISDLIIGAPQANSGNVGNAISAGQSYVLFGRNSLAVIPVLFGADINLSSMVADEGFVINGIITDDLSGWSVSNAGDVNGDAISDLIIGAPSDSTNSAGESYVIFGKNTPWALSFDLSTLNGTNGFTIKGIAAGDNSGWSVSSAGDINSDGISDIIIGAYRVNSITGESYVLFGRDSQAATPSLFPAVVNLSTLAAGAGTTGFVIKGINASDQSGSAVSSAGDINGDGFDDFMIGATHANPNNFADAGETYVIFGRGPGIAWSAIFNLSSLSAAIADGTTGFVVNGITSLDSSGVAVSSAGDVNGDGIIDLIIGGPNADPNGLNKAGQSYVVFGCNYTSLITAQLCTK